MSTSVSVASDPSADRRPLGGRAAPLAVTMGDPAGIGGDILLSAWHEREAHRLSTFFVLDDPVRLRALSTSLGLDIPIEQIAHPAEATDLFDRALPVVPLALPAPVVPGEPSAENAPAVIEAIERGVAHCMAGEAAAVVTNPISKAILRRAGFAHPGHTEFLAQLGGAAEAPVMMLVSPQLRVVPTTVHLPLAAVSEALSLDLIVATCRTVLAALARDFDIDRPRIAVSGLNPHAGESGTLGREEIDIIEPACRQLRAEGHEVLGPLAADTMFHTAARAGYDAAVCMYHDQALVPLKTLDFDHGVNVTLGLPFIRTSPDHGTAFSIAGTGKANPTSLIEALRLANEMSRTRLRNQQARPAD